MSTPNSQAKTTSYVLFGIGGLLFLVGSLLAAQGTTEIGLFIFYIVMVFAGLGLIILGQKYAKRG